MISKIYIIDSSLEKALKIKELLELNNIKSTEIIIPELKYFDDLDNILEAKLDLCKKQFILSPKNIYIFDNYTNDTSILSIYYSEKFTHIVGSDFKETISKYILSTFIYHLSDITVRYDFDQLNKFISDEGNISFNHSFLPWIKSYNLFNILNRGLYENLVTFTLNERGMFPKVWRLSLSKNYWNSSLNGGLPIIKKSDEIHEATYLIHDIFHFIFKDPILTGDESEQERKFYIAYRMMSEAFTLVMADMVSIFFSSIDQNYDTSKRQIYPLFQSLNLDVENLNDLFTLLYSNSYYCLFGDDYYFKKYTTDLNALEKYKSKYGVFFVVDFEWNKSNIENYLAQDLNKKSFFDFLPNEISDWNSKDLTKKVAIDDENISFDNLFLIFWEQLLEMFEYFDEFDELKYTRLAVSKYLSGQMFIFFMYDLDSNYTLNQYKSNLDSISWSETKIDILNKYNIGINIFNTYISKLEKNNVLLPHDVVNFKLHVPLFPAKFISYDKPKDLYEPLNVVSEKIFNGTLIQSDYFKDAIEKAITESQVSNYKRITMKKGKIVVICGPSGVGKDTIINYLIKTTNFRKNPAYTTRDPRPGEKDGIDYRFVSEEDFSILMKNNEFLDFITLNGFHYGTPISDFQKIIRNGEQVVIHLAISSAFLLKEKVDNVKIIFIEAPSKKDLIDRLRNRGGMTEEQIEIRISEDPTDYSLLDNCDFKILNKNDEQDKTSEIIRKYLESN